MKVKVIRDYHDKQFNKQMTVNSPEFEVDQARAEVLVNAGVCVIVEDTPTTEKKVEKKPRTKKGE